MSLNPPLPSYKVLKFTLYTTRSLQEKYGENISISEQQQHVRSPVTYKYKREMIHSEFRHMLELKGRLRVTYF